VLRLLSLMLLLLLLLSLMTRIHFALQLSGERVQGLLRG
jgi:hypothetical protein